MNEIQIQQIFNDDIKSDLQNNCIPSNHPITIFLGGQPGAGKTNAQRTLVKAYPNKHIMPIVGDDFRAYYPNYKVIIKNDPIHMPDITAKAAGTWTGMSVDWAREHNVSCIIEGTWRKPAVVLDEATRAKSAGRRIHAAILSVPPLMSRTAILERYYIDLQTNGQARWTPPNAHDETVNKLPKNIQTILETANFDQVNIYDRHGSVLYSGTDTQSAYNTWRDNFKRILTCDEIETLQHTLDNIQQIHNELDANNAQAQNIIEQLAQQLHRENNIRALSQTPQNTINPTQQQAL